MHLLVVYTFYKCIISPAVVLFWLIAGYLWCRPMLWHVVTIFIHLDYQECINIESHFYAPFFFSTFLISIVASEMCGRCTVTFEKAKEIFIIIIRPADPDYLIILYLSLLCCLMQPGPCFCYYSLVNKVTTCHNIGLNQSKLSTTITLIIIIHIM
jgi:hypothetical protein